MKDYATVYFIYSCLPFRLIRLGFLIVLLWLIYFAGSNVILFFLSLFLIIEVFFRFKISRVCPQIEVSNNNSKDIHSSFTLQALNLLVLCTNSQTVVKRLLKTKSVKFILEKLDVLDENELKIVDVPKEEIVRSAFGIARKLQGKFVTPTDLFASYILLTEETTKNLFNKNLKKEDFLQIVIWARTRFSQEENPKALRVEFWGEGIGENWVFGWTVETKKYMADLTRDVLSRKPIILGREKELLELKEAMYKGKSALLVGEPGSGRTEIAQYLAFESFIGNLKGSLFHQKFYQLLVDALIAGTDKAGDLESRLDALIAEVAHAGNIIIFLPSFENILGSSSFRLDLSGVLTPYLERGAIRMVGTISPGAYKKFVEGRKTFTNNLEIIKVDEPDSKRVLSMIFKKSEELETARVKLSYRAIISSLKYSKKYLPDRVLPGSAITLIKDTVAAVSLSGKKIVEEKDIIEKIEEKTNTPIGKPREKEKKLLLALEDEIHKRVVDQKEAVSAVSEALRRLRSGLTSGNKPISFLFLGPTGVGKTETAKTLSKIYFGGDPSASSGQGGKMIRFDMSEYSSQDSLKRLLGSMPGEEETPGELTDKIYENPFSLVLLDEFEKANPQILNLFLQILDDGRLTDNRGRTVSFTDAIIIATSNAGSEFIREEVGKGTKVDKKFQQTLIDLLQKQGILKPELLNRFDGVIVFKPLGEDEVRKVTEILLSEFKTKMLEQDVTIAFDNKIIDKIVKEGFDKQFGARPLRRYIEENIEDLIAKKLLKDEIKRGDKMTLSVDQNNNIVI